MLKVTKLESRIEEKNILNGIDLEIRPGELVAIMGPNGSGKSSLASILAGVSDQETVGSIEFAGQDLLEMSAHERAAAGLFLAFQQPVEIPGVTGLEFLKASMKSIRKARGEGELSPAVLAAAIQKFAGLLRLPKEALTREFNVGASGGEKKKMELLQLLLLDPKLAILDEIDSGLDVDALKIVATAIREFRTPANSVLLITHYPPILELLRPDRIIVLAQGRIVAEGGAEIAEQILQFGYDSFTNKK